MALDETAVNNALAELIRKFSVTWYLLTAILSVMNQDSPMLMARIKGTLLTARASQPDPQRRAVMDEALAMLETLQVP
jgi:hypothetical protein